MDRYIFFDPWGSQSFITSKQKKIMGKTVTVIKSKQCLCLVGCFCMLSVLMLFMVNIGNIFSSLTCQEFLPAGQNRSLCCWLKVGKFLVI